MAQELPSAGTTTTLPTAAAPTMGPRLMSQDDVLLALKKKEPADELIQELKKRGVDFEVDEEIEKKLHKAKASDEEIKAVKDAGPKARADAARAAAIASGAPDFSKEEKDDIKAIEAEVDPDKSIALAEEDAKKHPEDKDFMSYAYVFEAYSYEKKNDADKALEYAEKSLALKPDNLMALLTATHVIPQPRYIRSHQADEDKVLAKAMAYSKDAEKGVGELKKQPNEMDEAFANRKAEYMCDLYADRGMIHMDLAQLGLMSVDKDELAKSIEDYNKAVSCTQPLASDYYRLGEANSMMGKTDDAIAAFSRASELGQGIIKQMADQKVATLKASKAGATAPKP
jgi:tetratricopeptide (TPR) repeat protein